MDAVTNPPAPVNEPPLAYPEGSVEFGLLGSAWSAARDSIVEIRPVVGGAEISPCGETLTVVEPHRHDWVLATVEVSDAGTAQAAIGAAREAAPAWRELSFDDRAAVFLRAADLLAGPWRPVLNAATMLGQSKTVSQAEIDAACELIDFFRFNVAYARQILEHQPTANARAVWNRVDYRPLEGFVYAISPFNFTSIAGNLPTAPALMGNTVLWKPAVTAQLSAYRIMQLLAEAGLPPGVINMLPGHGPEISAEVLPHPDLAGIHFTGSTRVFQQLWNRVGENIAGYRSYPRLVGETGGKNFLLAHPSADPAVVVEALVRGAFEYQGQKCSAASRAYLPRSLWTVVRDDLVGQAEALRVGDVTDRSTALGAVIDERAFVRLRDVLARVHRDPALTVLADGGCDDTIGYFVEPTIFQVTDPGHEVMTEEYFGPLLGVYVYDDNAFDQVLSTIDGTSRYGLTGSIIARDRSAIATATATLRFSAGNFYVNDKPTGAVVGQQPFGGARGSGTNDKAGSLWNLARWTSPRAIKEAMVPPARDPFFRSDGSAAPVGDI